MAIIVSIYNCNYNTLATPFRDNILTYKYFIIYDIDDWICFIKA